MSITQKRKQIKELLKRWGEIACSDHHKDRDCHFHIDQDWCIYEDNPEWSVIHRGYVDKDWEYFAETYDEALDILITQLERAIRTWGT